MQHIIIRTLVSIAFLPTSLLNILCVNVPLIQSYKIVSTSLSFLDLDKVLTLLSKPLKIMWCIY